MLRLDEDAVICDFAETYHIFDLRGLPLHTVAVLACGLSEDCRIKKKMVNRRLSLDQALLASVLDRLTMLLWINTTDGRKGRNKPKSILEALERPPERKHKVFTSVSEFERKRAQILRS